MRILFAMSIFALAALLWAAISVARHVRRARFLKNRAGTPLANRSAERIE